MMFYPSLHSNLLPYILLYLSSSSSILYIYRTSTLSETQTHACQKPTLLASYARYWHLLASYATGIVPRGQLLFLACAMCFPSFNAVQMSVQTCDEKNMAMPASPRFVSPKRFSSLQ